MVDDDAGGPQLSIEVCEHLQNIPHLDVVVLICAVKVTETVINNNFTPQGLDPLQELFPVALTGEIVPFISFGVFDPVPYRLHACPQACQHFLDPVFLRVL